MLMVVVGRRDGQRHKGDEQERHGVLVEQKGTEIMDASDWEGTCMRQHCECIVLYGTFFPSPERVGRV